MSGFGVIDLPVCCRCRLRFKDNGTMVAHEAVCKVPWNASLEEKMEAENRRVGERKTAEKRGAAKTDYPIDTVVPETNLILSAMDKYPRERKTILAGNLNRVVSEAVEWGQSHPFPEVVEEETRLAFWRGQNHPSDEQKVKLRGEVLEEAAKFADDCKCTENICGADMIAKAIRSLKQVDGTSGDKP